MNKKENFILNLLDDVSAGVMSSSLTSLNLRVF